MTNLYHYLFSAFLILFSLQVGYSFNLDTWSSDTSFSTIVTSDSTLVRSGAAPLHEVNYSSGAVTMEESLLHLHGYAVQIQYHSDGVEKKASLWNRSNPTGIVGLGWALKRSKIVRNAKNTGSELDDSYYLNIDGTTHELIYFDKQDSTGFPTKKYFVKSNPNWKIHRNLSLDQWVLIKEDGTKYIFGDGSLVESPNRNSTEKAVKWGNWIGASIDPNNQSNFSTAWNLVQILSVTQIPVDFYYQQVEDQIGKNGKLFTKAIYLDYVVDYTGEMIKFIYGSKEPNEYVDPHAENQILADKDQDAYQERYERRYLDKLELHNSKGLVIEKIDFDYAFLSADFPSLKKRVLTRINFLNQNDKASHPAHLFDYYGLNNNDNVKAGLKRSDTRLFNQENGALFGALKSQTTVEGATYRYQYGEIEIENSGLDRLIEFPDTLVYDSQYGWENGMAKSSWKAPQLFFGTDYVVAIFEPIALDARISHVQVYQWLGDRWKLAYNELLPAIFYDNYKELDDYDQGFLSNLKGDVMQDINENIPMIGGFLNAFNDGIKERVVTLEKGVEDFGKGKIGEGLKEFFLGGFEALGEALKDIAVGFKKTFDHLGDIIIAATGTDKDNYDRLQRDLYEKNQTYEEKFPRKEYHITLQSDFFALASSDRSAPLWIFRQSDLDKTKWNKSVKTLNLPGKYFPKTTEDSTKINTGKYFTLASGDKFLTVLDEMLDLVHIYFWDGEVWQTQVTGLDMGNTRAYSTTELKKIYGFADYKNIENWRINPDSEKYKLFQDANAAKIQKTKEIRSALSATNNVIVAALMNNAGDDIKVYIMHHDEHFNWEIQSEEIQLLPENTQGQGQAKAMYEAMFSQEGKMVLQAGASMASLQTYTNLDPNIFKLPGDLIPIVGNLVDDFVADYRKYNATIGIFWDEDYKPQIEYLHQGIAQSSITTNLSGNVIHKQGKSKSLIENSNDALFPDDGKNFAFHFSGNNFTLFKFPSPYKSNAISPTITSGVLESGMDKNPVFYQFDANNGTVALSRSDASVLINALEKILNDGKSSNLNYQIKNVLIPALEKSMIPDEKAWVLIDDDSLSSQAIPTREFIDEIIDVSSDVINDIIQIIAMVIPGLQAMGAMEAEMVEVLESVSKVANNLGMLMQFVQPISDGLLEGIIKKNHFGTSITQDYIFVNNKIFARTTDGSWSLVGKAFDLGNKEKIVGNNNRVLADFVPYTVLKDGEVINYVSILKNGQLFDKIKLQEPGMVCHQDSLSQVMGPMSFVTYGETGTEHLGYVKENSALKKYLPEGSTTKERNLHAAYRDATIVKLHRVINGKVSGPVKDYVVQQVQINDGFEDTYHSFLYAQGDINASSGIGTYGKVIDVPSDKPVKDFDVLQAGDYQNGGYEEHYFYNRYNYAYEGTQIGLVDTLKQLKKTALVKGDPLLANQVNNEQTNPVEHILGLPYLTNSFDYRNSLIQSHVTSYQLWYDLVTDNPDEKEFIIYPLFISKQIGTTSILDGVESKESYEYEPFKYRIRKHHSYAINTDNEQEIKTEEYWYADESNPSFEEDNRLQEKSTIIEYYSQANGAPHITACHTTAYKPFSVNGKQIILPAALYQAKLSDSLLLSGNKLRYAGMAEGDLIRQNQAIEAYEVALDSLSFAIGNYPDAKKAGFKAKEAADRKFIEFQDIHYQLSALKSKLDQASMDLIKDDKKVKKEREKYADKTTERDLIYQQYLDAKKNTDDKWELYQEAVKTYNDNRSGAKGFGYGFLCGFTFGGYCAPISPDAKDVAYLNYRIAYLTDSIFWDAYLSANDDLNNISQTIQGFTDKHNQIFRNKNRIKDAIDRSTASLNQIKKNANPFLDKSYKAFHRDETNDHLDLRNQHLQPSTHLGLFNAHAKSYKWVINWDVKEKIEEMQTEISGVPEYEDAFKHILDEAVNHFEKINKHRTQFQNALQNLNGHHQMVASRLGNIVSKKMKMDQLQGYRSHWVETKRIHSYDSKTGKAISWIDARNTEHSLLLDKNRVNTLVHVSNADINQQEVIYLGFEDYERYAPPIGGTTTDLESHTGKRALQMNSKQPLRFPALKVNSPNAVDNVFVLSAWIFSKQDADITLAFGFQNSSGKYNSKTFLVANQWKYIEIVIDETISGPWALLYLGEQQILLDDVLLRPLNSIVEISAYNEHNQPTAHISNNGLTRRIYYDPHNYHLLTIDNTGLIAPIHYNSYTRSTNLTKFKTAPPNGKLSLQFHGQATMISDLQSQYQMEPASFFEDFAIGYSVFQKVPYSIQIEGHEIEVTKNKLRYLKNSTTMEEVPIQQFPDNWILLKIGNLLSIYGDGENLLEFEFPTIVKHPIITFKNQTGTNPNHVKNRFYANAPDPSQEYSNGLGAVIQKQHFEFDDAGNIIGKVCIESLHNGWGKAEIVTLPALINSRKFSFESNFVQSFDWENGILEGAISDFYAHDSTLILQPEDKDFAYIRTVHERNPLARKVGTIQAGAAFHNISDNQTKVKYQAILGKEDLKRVGISRQLLNEFFNKTTFKSNGYFESISHDKFGRKIIDNISGSLTLTKYGYSKEGYPIHTVIQPNHFLADSLEMALDDNSLYVNKMVLGDMLGHFTTNVDIDGGKTTVIKDPMGQETFVLRNEGHNDDFHDKTPVNIWIDWPQGSGENLVQIRDLRNQQIVWSHADSKSPFSGDGGNYFQELILFLKPGSYVLECTDLQGDGWNGNGTIQLIVEGASIVDAYHHSKQHGLLFSEIPFEVGRVTQKHQVNIQLNWPAWSGENSVAIKDEMDQTVWSHKSSGNYFFKHRFNDTISLPPGQYYLETHDLKNDGWAKKGEISVQLDGQPVIEKFHHKKTKKTNGLCKVLETIFLSTYVEKKYAKNPLPVIQPIKIDPTYKVLVDVNYLENSKGRILNIKDEAGTIVWTFQPTNTQPVKGSYSVQLSPGNYSLEIERENHDTWNGQGAVTVRYMQDTLLGTYYFGTHDKNDSEILTFSFGKKPAPSAISPHTEKQYEYFIYDQMGRKVEAGNVFSAFDRDKLETLSASGFWNDVDKQMRQTWIYNADRNQDTENYKGRLSESTLYQDNYQTTERYTYDIHGRVIELSQELTGSANPPIVKTFKYDYHLDGKIKKISYPEGIEVYYDYDKRGRLKEVGTHVDPSAYAFYTYHWDGKIATIETNQRTVVETKQYDLLGHLKGTTVQHSNKKLFQESFDYFESDGSYVNGNIVRDTENGDFVKKATNNVYEYDPQYQLKKWIKSAKNVKSNFSYEYDANQNLLSTENTKKKKLKRFHFEHGSNRLKYHGTVKTNENGQINQLNTPAFGPSHIQYDLFTLRPISVQSVNQPSEQVRILYTPTDKRMAKIHLNNNQIIDSLSKWYFHGHHDLPLLEISSNKTQGQQSDYQQSFIYGLGYGPVASIVQNGKNPKMNYHFIRDHLGSTRMVLSKANKLLQRYDYGVNGVIVKANRPKPNSPDFNYLYTGQEFDKELGLYNYRARWYKPEWQRFLSIDPVRTLVSPYIYVDNNPVNAVDPTGAISFLPVLGIAFNRYRKSLPLIGKTLYKQSKVLSKATGAYLKRNRGKIDDYLGRKNKPFEALGAKMADNVSQRANRLLLKARGYFNSFGDPWRKMKGSPRLLFKNRDYTILKAGESLSEVGWNNTADPFFDRMTRGTSSTQSNLMSRLMGTQVSNKGLIPYSRPFPGRMKMAFGLGRVVFGVLGKRYE